MRLFFACHGTESTGAELTLLALARAAVGRGDDVTFALPPHGGDLRGRLEAELPQALVVRVPTTWWVGTKHRGAAGLLRTAKALTQVLPWVRALRRGAPDAVIAGSTVAPAPLIAARLLHRPLVVLLSESLLDNPTLEAPVSKRWHLLLVKRWATVTVAVSHYVDRQLGGADMVEPPPIVSSPQPDEHSVREAGEPLRLAMFGTLSPEKGQLDAVLALDILRQRGVPVRLSLFGHAAPHDLAALQAEVVARSLQDYVRHLGTATEVHRELGRVDATIVLSRNEAYGRVTAESLLAGTPVVAYNLGGTAEILAGGGGILSAAEPTALADALQRLAGDDALLARLRRDAARAADSPAISLSPEQALDRMLRRALGGGDAAPHQHVRSTDGDAA